MSELGDETADRCLEVMHSASFDLNAFQGVTRAKDCRQLVQHEGKQMVVANVYEKRILNKSMRGVQGESLVLLARYTRDAERPGIAYDGIKRCDVSI